MKAWHFVSEDCVLRYGDNRLVEAGTYSVDCEPVLCRSGLHASVKPLDALWYAPGPVVCRVRMGGYIVVGDDKIAATERTVLWVADISDVLREFARWCAWRVAHLWSPPRVVTDYLLAGDVSLQDAAWDAAWDAAAWAAAHAAAQDAARVAAHAAAHAAARVAAQDAARVAQDRKLSRMLHVVGRSQ